MGFLGNLFGGAGDALNNFFADGAIEFLAQVISSIFQYMLALFNALLGYIVTVFKGIASFFETLWRDFFSKIFVNIYHAIASLTKWLEDHIGPIIDWLRRAQQYILRLYNTYVRPILVMIQRVRQVLTILRALHIQWAQDLDNILAHVQSDINGIFLKITGTLNAVIDVLNIVTDPARLLRHPTLILSVRRSFLALIRQLTGLPPGFWLPSTKGNAAQGITAIPANFNFTNPAQNPPASFYMGLSSPVPPLDGIATGEVVPDDYGDDVTSFDFVSLTTDLNTDCGSGGPCFLEVVQGVIATA